MIRSLFLVFVTGVCSILGCFIAFVSGKDFPEWVVMGWTKLCVQAARIKLHVSGKENIPEAGNLFVINHTSLFDIPVAHQSISKRVRFGAKIELFKIPLFSWAMRKSGILPIARTQLAQVIQVYEQASLRIKSGESFVLAPEGTRQKTDTALGNFKTGPFVLAIKAQCLITPVVVYGTSKVLSKGKVTIDGSHEHHVLVRILPSVPTKGLSLSDRDELKDQVFSMMSKNFMEMAEAAKSGPHPG